ncbi:MAG: phenylacetate-CoA oxygenase subunit PaaJ [Bacteroidia bacterium]|nr:phenylacetate-CoA oxygenase subunit PaaJ [Bacteroidia bacterium]HQV00703.1 phenylacetate-CoA oxygenase subunit PaaJ [Bacteroidia bacterium]
MPVPAQHTEQSILQLLDAVFDPEVPVLTIAELGVLRKVTLLDNVFNIVITPTYSGCPAMQTIAADITAVMETNGVFNFKITTIIAPPWTTDWMSDTAKQKLKAYGIAPPTNTTANHLASILNRKKSPTTCPFCNATDTKLTSAFGSTACKALHYCNHCQQPFEEFKCH